MGKSMTPATIGPKMASMAPKTPMVGIKKPPMGPQMGLPAAHGSMNSQVDHAPGGTKGAASASMPSQGGHPYGAVNK